MAAIVYSYVVEEDGQLRVFSAMWAVLIPTARYYVYRTGMCGTCTRKERYQTASMIHTSQSLFRKVERSEEKLVITRCDQDKLL